MTIGDQVFDSPRALCIFIGQETWQTVVIVGVTRKQSLAMVIGTKIDIIGSIIAHDKGRAGQANAAIGPDANM